MLRIFLLIICAFLGTGVCKSFTQSEDSSVRVTLVSATPQATIYVNDVELGADSCDAKLLPGNYTVKVTRKGWRELMMEVVIKNVDNQRIVIPEMEQLFAMLKVDYSPYGSTVYINGEERGQTPLNLRLPLTVYGLKIEQNGKVLFNSPVVLKKEGENIIVDNEHGMRSLSNNGMQSQQDVGNIINQERALGDLTISCPTKDADILIDGKKTLGMYGRTYWVGKIECGMHTIVIAKEGYDSRTTTVDVNVTQPSSALFAPLKKTGTSVTQRIDADSGTLPQLQNVMDALEDSIYEIAEQVPSFPGGEEALRKYFQDHIQYPKIADKNFIDGLFEMLFVVEKDGSISHVNPHTSEVTQYNELVKDKLNPDLSKDCAKLFTEEIKKAFKNMPKWNPAMTKGNVVRYRCPIYILFGQGAIQQQAASSIKPIYIGGKNTLDKLYSGKSGLSKDMHLYKVGNECWISGLNKNIMTLTEDEMRQIMGKSHTAYTDIVRMRLFLSNELDIYDFLQGNYHPNTTRPEFKDGNKDLDDYMIEKLEKSTFESLCVNISFFVELNGRISCPVVEKCSDLKLAGKIVNYLRETENWKPAQKDSKPIGARITRTFSYKRTVKWAPSR